jgi:aldehyde dehydrogenase (NAD+)
MNYAELVKKQNEFFNANHTKSISFRIGQLKKLKAIIEREEPRMHEAIYSDFKKSIADNYATELSFIYDELDLAIKKLPSWARHKRVRPTLLTLPSRSYLVPEPLGTCLVIGAWNYPYGISLVPLIAAMAAGNTAILKPSEIPSATSALMARMINENFPAEYIHVVEGGIAESTALLEQKFDKIFFTGSTKVGRIVYQAAAKNLTPVTLELGGKSPAIVTRDTNIKGAAKRIVFGKFLNSGQTCIAPDYVLVDKAVQDEFLRYVKDYIRQFDYSFANGNYIQIINEENFLRLTGLIARQKVYVGGDSDMASRYIAPTILTDVSFDDPVMQEEIFGPVLAVISYTKLEDAIAGIKAMPRPLSLYLFTHDKAIKQRVLSEISFGGGAINHTLWHFANANLPFGGVGESGTGSYHGRSGFTTFSHFKSILEKPFYLEPDLVYPPNTKKKMSLIRWLSRL